MVDDGVEASAEGPSAGRAFTVFADSDQTVALLFQLRVLLAQGLTLGLSLLPVSHPLGAARFEKALRVFQLGALLLQLEGRFLLERRGALDLLVALLQARNLFAQCGFALEQCFPAAFLAIEGVQSLELDVQRVQRLDRKSKRIQLRTGRLHAFQLVGDALRIATERGFLFFADGDLRQQLRRLLALTLHHFPTRLDRHELALTHRTLVRSMLRPRLSLLLSRGCFREIAQNNLGIRHAALHSLDPRAHTISLVARQVLGDAQLLIPQHPGKKLPATGRLHRRHHVQLFLSREIGVIELGERHAQPALQQVVGCGDRIRDRIVRAVEIDFSTGKTSHNSIAVRPQLELELDFYGRASTRSDEANRIAIATDGGVAVQRPRNRLQNRRLAGAVRTNDAGKTALESDPGARMLTEIGEPEFVQPHAGTSSAAGPATRSASRR